MFKHFTTLFIKLITQHIKCKYKQNPVTYIGIIGNSTKTTHQTLKLGKCIYLLNKVGYFLNWMPAAHFNKLKQGCVYCCNTSSFSKRLMTLSVGKHYSLNSPAQSLKSRTPTLLLKNVLQIIWFCIYLHFTLFPSALETWLHVMIYE